MSENNQHLETLSLKQQSEIDAIAEAFEAALADSDETELAPFLPADESLLRAAVIELLHAEVESRARRGLDSNLPERLRQYEPVIGDEGTAVEMVISEVELRERLGIRMRAVDVIANYPKLTEPLSEFFQGRSDVNDSRLVRLNCPHCQNPISAKHDSNLGVLCPTCGSQFRVEDQTLTWRPSKLPNLGRFQLLEAVGRGAFGTVYRARDLELQRIVAVKVPRSGVFALEEDEDRFIREARSAAQLSHPGIVPVYEVGRADAFPFIVAEYVDGVTLNDVLSARRLAYQESAELIVELADALQHAHEQGVIHRDMKPSNVMLQRETDSAAGTKQIARLMDFGLALRDDGEVTVTLEGQPLGTPAYMSPEQARGEGHRVDGRTDIYSLGVILYQLLVGELPFRGSSRMLVQQVQYDEPKSPRSLNDTIPRDLETVCLKAMAKEPQRRYQSATEMADDLRRFLRGEPIHARATGTMERTWRWCRRNPLATTLYGVILVALILVSFAYTVAQQARLQSLAQERRALEQQRRAEDNLRSTWNEIDGFIDDAATMAGAQADTSELLASLASRATDHFQEFVDTEETGPSAMLEKGFGYMHLSNVVRSLGKEDEAIEYLRQGADTFQRLADNYPDDHVHWLELAQSQYILGQQLLSAEETDAALELFAKAKANYLEAAEHAPSTHARNIIAWFLVSCPASEFWEPEKAVVLATSAHEEDNESPTYLNTLGAALYRDGEFAQAIEKLGDANVAAKAKGRLADYRKWNDVFLVMAYQRAGRHREAKKAANRLNGAEKNRNLVFQHLLRESRQILKDPPKD